MGIDPTRGFVAFPRGLTEWEWYTEPNTARLFFHLLLTANWQEKQWQGITIHPGELVTSQSQLAKQLGLSVRNVRTALEHLQVTGYLTVKTGSKYSVISISNWGAYQSDEQQVDNKWTSSEQQVDTNKNEKNYKNEKNIDNNNGEYPAELIQTLYGKFPSGILQSAISEWLKTWPREMICFAIQTSFDYGKELNALKPYINRILDNWASVGIDTVEKAIEANNQFKQKQIRPSKPNGFGRVTRKEELPDRFVNPPIEKENPEVQEEIARRLREYEANRRKEEV